MWVGLGTEDTYIQDKIIQLPVKKCGRSGASPIIFRPDYAEMAKPNV